MYIDYFPDFLFLPKSLCIFMAKTIQLHVHVIALVMNMDHMMPLSWVRPWSMKAPAPIAIMRNVGSAMPSVFRVRIVSIACGRYPDIMHMLAT